MAAQHNKQLAQEGIPQKPKQDRYTAELNNIQATAAFGVDPMEIMRAKSKGRFDPVREVRISIRREFFTASSVFSISVWFFILGCFVITLAFNFLVPAMRWKPMDAPLYNMSVFVLCFVIGDAFTQYRATHNLSHCTQEKKRFLDEDGQFKTDFVVEPQFRKRPCLSDEDCTDTFPKRYQRGACTNKPQGTWHKRKRRVFTPIVGLLGLGFSVFGFITGSKDTTYIEDLMQAAIYGLGSGVIFSLIWT